MEDDTIGELYARVLGVGFGLAVSSIAITLGVAIGGFIDPPATLAMPIIWLVGSLLSIASAVVGAAITHRKGRTVAEGLTLGSLLSVFGVIVTLFLPRLA